ncbi:PQQ-binding-like beta-propeller repeat protein [Actinomadura namibiensis]|uniref:outer membrane protein assembly factor BamB family protein n=1 Tax=Actinomadura kijaniata TaxID=46161 RepID=UPI003609DC96
MRKAWTAPTAAPVVASPLLADDALIVADAGGNVHSFDARTGAERWRRSDPVEDWREHGAAFSLTPATWNGWVFVEAVSGLHVRDARSGDLIRELDHGCPTVVGDLLLVHTLSAGVRAFRLPELTPVWSRGWNGWMRVSPAVAEGKAYATLGFEEQRTHGGILAFDPVTGDEVFRRYDEDESCPLRQAGEAEDRLTFSPVHAVAGEGLVWLPRDRDHLDEGHDPGPWNALEIVGLDPRTGEDRWCHRLDPALESYEAHAVAVADGTVYFGAALCGEAASMETDADLVLHAVDIPSGATRWTRLLPGLAAAPEVSGGTVYAVTDLGEVHALDAATGNAVWTAEAGAAISHPHAFVEEPSNSYDEGGAAVVMGDRMLYVRTDAGVVALR